MAGAGQASATKNICSRMCRKQPTKNLNPSPMAKNRTCFRLGEDRRTPRATSRLLDHGSTWYLRGRHLHSLALPDTKRVGRGLILCRDRRSIVAWAVFIACWQLSTWTIYLQQKYFKNSLETKLCNIVFPLSSVEGPVLMRKYYLKILSEKITKVQH